MNVQSYVSRTTFDVGGMFDVAGMTIVHVVYHPISDVARITPQLYIGISTLLLEVS
jgi:hypothetical protein